MKKPIAIILSIFLCVVAAVASEIRVFDVKTLERLGNELTRASQRADRGATTPERKRAQQTAKAALQGHLFDIHYDYVVLDDPGGNGLLVYAVGSTGNAGQFGIKSRGQIYTFDIRLLKAVLTS